ncbi:uncharacterized protein PAC_10192 [Phialocephala subalpina]|uniref:Uncharacterized protein n=1 Tax=Phialocephala subalpina TaxID=576137 RepID=A0A1L7X5K1_9HELO|nr:uncharacterized protein PAC_10192 [Phialocephala subalpina]
MAPNFENPEAMLIGNYFRAIRDTLISPIHRDSYLNGALKDRVLPSTHVVDIYTMLIESELVDDSIKPALITCRKEFIQGRARYQKTNSATEAALIACSTSLREVEMHMEDEAKGRGLWFPDDRGADGHGQFMGENQGNTLQFVSLIEEGYPKGATEEFKKRDEAYKKYRKENPVSDDTFSYRPEDEKMLAGEEKKSEGDDAGVHFGRGFGKKLGQAFGDDEVGKAAKFMFEGGKLKKKQTKAESEWGTNHLEVPSPLRHSLPSGGYVSFLGFV